MVSVTDHGVTAKIVVDKVCSVHAGAMYVFGKRVFDVLLSAIALILFAIPMGIIAIVIKIDTKGPAIYKQVRLGKDEKSFVMYKFRSMRIDAEKDGICWAEVNDPRVTKVGTFLRKYRLDELPQLINIISGQMSIVGPRPERPEFYDKFDEYIDGFRQRMLVKPGLTGLAQVNGGYDLKPEEKIIYDMEYIQNQSLMQEIRIIIKTLAVVLGKHGAR